MKLDNSRDRAETAGLTRRGLLRAAGLGAGALYLAGCAGTSQQLLSSRRRVQVQSGIPGPNAAGGETGGLITIGWEQEGNSDLRSQRRRPISQRVFFF